MLALRRFQFLTRAVSAMLHSVNVGNGCYYHNPGERKFPIHTLPFDIEYEWTTATRVYLATRRETPPRKLKEDESFLTRCEGKVVLIEVITTLSEHGLPVGRYAPPLCSGGA
jgi:hypothetical protein